MIQKSDYFPGYSTTKGVMNTLNQALILIKKKSNIYPDL